MRTTFLSFVRLMRLAPVDTTPLPVPYIGNHTIYDFDNQGYHISIPANALVYRYCDQDFMRYRPFPVFPPLPSKQPEGKEWMTDEQEAIATAFGWTSLLVIVFVLLVFVHRFVVPLLRGLFRSNYRVSASTLTSPSVQTTHANQEKTAYGECEPAQLQ